MRIISGFLKGKKIDFLKSTTTRPLRDFVKESTFNVIEHSSLIKISLKNANILDLYSGVGSFGIECISSGAKKILFVESDAKTLAVLKKNLNNLKISNKAEVFEAKIISFFNHLNKKDKFEIIFFDPPFAENFFINDLIKLRDLKIFSKNHLIIIHRDKRSEDNLSDLINVVLTKKYGRSKIIFGNFNLNTA